jgi:transposase
MRKMREILRLHYELKLGQRQIARSTCVSQSTIHDYLERFARSGLSWPLAPEMTEAQLEAQLFPTPEVFIRAKARRIPDFGRIDDELRRNKHVTLQLLWEEYRAANSDGYGYSRFCHYYQQWRGNRDVVMRQQHRAGEKLFVDWAGAKIPIYSRDSSGVHEASLFVAVLGASNYTYAEATRSQDTACWIGAHVRAFEYIGGLPELVVPDNPRTGVIRTCRYEPDLNPTYQEMAAHYGVGVLPARVRKPRDKAKVEVGVQIVQRWIVAALRHRRFFSLTELNQAIGELLEKLNQRQFRKRQGSRASLFAEIDHPALRPLPRERFDLSEWSRATVNIDYHVEYDHSFYSVPYQLVRQVVEVRATPAVIEIFHKGARVASHVRTHKKHEAITVNEHRPKSHRAHLEWPPSRIVQWAQTVGPHAGRVVEKILASYPHPEMGYRSCLGIIRLGQRYPTQRVEAAAERALRTGAVSFKSIQSILRRGLDQQPLGDTTPITPRLAHDNVRGAEYFQ